MVKYTIVMCNLNMGDTLEESVKSIYTQVSAEFEILVVDGGSSDDSPVVLDKLETECDRVRSIRLDQNSQRRLGEERNIGVRQANGEYILLQMDADDRYHEGILDFVEVYHQLEERIEREFYLKGDSINMASREFLLRYGPYRNIHAGEDEDLWRRLFEDDVIIWLDHEPFVEEIKDYKSGIINNFQRALDKRTGDIQSGVSLISCLYWSMVCNNSWQSALMYILGYLNSFNRESYETPDPFNRKEAIKTVIKCERATLPQHEAELNIAINRQDITDSGRKIFYQND